GRVPVMELLLKRGATLEAREKLRGTTALMWAAANSNTDAVKFLIARGADINAHSATTPPGRRPYIAPPGRERIQEFIDGTGLRGAVVEDAADAKPPGEADTPAAREAAQRRFQAEITAAKGAIAKFE